MNATRRAVLGAGLSLAATSASAGINSHGTKKSPDADLLALCAQLTAMQAEWQRLWTFTTDDWGLDDPPVTDADRAWEHYNDHVWPGIHVSGGTPRLPDDLPGQLLDFHPVTPEGVRAKAAAVLAMEDAACYGADARNDACEMYQSVLVDAAGAARMLMGEDAQASPPPLPGRGTT